MTQNPSTHLTFVTCLSNAVCIPPRQGGRAKFVSEPVSSSLFAAAAPRRLKADEALFVAGQSGDGCYRLERGLLKVVVTSPGGEERILAMLGPGAIVGELAMLDEGPRSASVFAVRECELSFISLRVFEERTIWHPEIYQYLVNVLATRLRQTDEAMAASCFMTIQARLARVLLELGKYVGEDDRRRTRRDRPQDQPERPCGDGRCGA